MDVLYRKYKNHEIRLVFLPGLERDLVLYIEYISFLYIIYFYKPKLLYKKPGAIIPKSRLQMLKQPDIIDFPVLMGYNSFEGLILAVTFHKKFDIYEKDAGILLPTTLDLHRHCADGIEFSKIMKEFYFNGKQVDKKTIPELITLVSDRYFLLPVWIIAEIHATYQPR